MTTPNDSSTPGSLPRFSRRRIFPLVGVAAAALIPTVASAQGSSPSGAVEIQASQSGTLTGSGAGSFAYYQISSPGSAAVTLTLTYAPFDVTWAHAIGFNVYQNGSKVAGAMGQSQPLGDQASAPTATATFTPSSSAGVVLIQVFNYSPMTISYSFTSSSSSSSPAPSTGATSTAQARYVYVGTYTAPNTAPGGTTPSTAIGIYVYKMEPTAGGLTLVQTVPTQNPSWVTLDPAMKYLYSTSELGTVNGKPGGMVNAWAIDPSTGMLTFLNSQLTNGTFPAHCNVHPSGKYLLGTNYGTGNFPIYPILSDGRLGAMTDDWFDQGFGPNLDRQEGPHAHEILTDPGANFVFGADLGTDRVDVWRFNLATGKLTGNTPIDYIQVAGGSGPRHVAFHPTSKWVYVIAEMASSITAFSYDATKGLAIWIQTVSTLPSDFTGTSACSEIVVHPNGRFVYGANRGHNSVAIFAIDQGSGKLTAVGWESTQGQIPRNFAIDPSGTFLFAANQNSNNIVVFRIDPNTGQLTPTGQNITSPTPVCVQFGRTV